jgi:hypothetical protein
VTQQGNGAVAGQSVEITDGDGVQYFYAHLSGFADDLSVGPPVKKGQLLGYVGTSGNARGTSPHLHLEIQSDGEPVPPKPYVDRWLTTAERRARQLVVRLRRAPEPVESTAPLARSPEMAAANLGVPTSIGALWLAGKEAGSSSLSGLELARPLTIAAIAASAAIWLLWWGRRRGPGPPAPSVPYGSPVLRATAVPPQHSAERARVGGCYTFPEGAAEWGPFFSVGGVAEWSGSGLQSRVHRFNSGPRLSGSMTAPGA